MIIELNLINKIFKKIIKNTDIDRQILAICKNFKPNLILFGHNNLLSRETILEIKNKYNTKLALWYEDHNKK